MSFHSFQDSINTSTMLGSAIAKMCIVCPLGEIRIQWPEISVLMGEGNLFGAHGSWLQRNPNWGWARGIDALSRKKNPNHSGGIITSVASVYRFLWPNKLFHTFSVEHASSECFMLLLFNHNIKNNSAKSSNKILEVLEKKKVHYPPQGSNV